MDDADLHDDRWLPACRFDRLTDEGVVAVHVAGVDLVLVLHAGRVIACERACPHEQADLARGHIRDGRLLCPHHAASFSLEDGAISSGWPSRPLRLYPVRIARGEVLVDATALKPSAH